MTKDEALRLALKAMVVNNQAWKHLADSGDAGYWEAEEQGYYQLNEQAIKAVEAALEAKDEPVAWMYEVNHAHTCLDLFEPPDDAYDEGTLYPLYTTPPQRKPLTDEEIVETFCKAPHQTQHVAWFAAGVRYAEATHGIKGKA